jgi:hypothetical protein
VTKTTEETVVRLFVGGPKNGEVRRMSDHVSSVEVPFMETDMLKIGYPSNPELRINHAFAIYRLKSVKFAFGEFDAMVCDSISKESANDLMRKLTKGMERFLINSAVDILEPSREGMQN